jgi:hypothetical protein
MKTITGVLFLLGVVTAAAWAKDPEMVFRVFDVRTLISPVRHFHGPSLLLWEQGEELPDVEAAFAMADEEESAFLPEDEIPDILRKMLDIEEEEDGSYMQVIRGRLYARLSPSRMARVEVLLASFEKEALHVLSFELLLFTVASDDSPDVLIDDRTVAKMVAEARAAPRRFLVSALNGQRVLVSVGAEQNFVSDYDIEVAPGVSMPHPVLSLFNTGTALLLRGMRNALDRSVLVTVGFSRTVPSSDRLELLEKTTPVGTLQSPRLNFSRLETTTVLPLDRWLVLRAPCKGEGTPGKAFTLLIKIRETPRPAEEEKKKKTVRSL